MKHIFIKESQIHLLKEEHEEITFYEFLVDVKSFLKELLTKPSDAKLPKMLTQKIEKENLLHKMEDLGIIKKSERIDEVPDEEKGKKVAKHYMQYKVPKSRFEEKVKELYKDVIEENTKSVFANEQEIIDGIKGMDDDNAYATRGGFKEPITEDGEGAGAMGGASSCGNVMQGGGSNPDAGQYTVPFGNVQRRKFYGDTLKRNKDEKNGSISMNRQK